MLCLKILQKTLQRNIGLDIGSRTWFLHPLSQILSEKILQRNPVMAMGTRNIALLPPLPHYFPSL